MFPYFFAGDCRLGWLLEASSTDGWRRGGWVDSFVDCNSVEKGHVKLMYEADAGQEATRCEKLNGERNRHRLELTLDVGNRPRSLALAFGVGGIRHLDRVAVAPWQKYRLCSMSDVIGPDDNPRPTEKQTHKIPILRARK